MLWVKIHLTLVGLLIVIFIIEKYPVTLYLILDLGSCNNSVGCYFANPPEHETQSRAPVPVWPEEPILTSPDFPVVWKIMDEPLHPSLLTQMMAIMKIMSIKSLLGVVKGQLVIIWFNDYNFKLRGPMIVYQWDYKPAVLLPPPSISSPPDLGKIIHFHLISSELK